MIKREPKDFDMREMLIKNPNTLLTRQFVLTKLLIGWSLLTFVGLLFVGSYYVARVSTNQPFSILAALNSQMLRFQIWTVMSVIVVLMDYKFRKRFQSWHHLFPLHLLSSVFWSSIATGIFCFLYWLFDGLINSRFLSLPEIIKTAWVSNLVMGILGYKIILTTNYALDYYKKFHEEKHRSAILETQLVQAQLQALKMQIQPHFLFNTLNSISNLALENPRTAVQMIARLGDFLRLTIDNNGTQNVSLKEEIEFLKCYLEIEQIRFPDRLKVEIDVAPETLSASVPNLILQPIVENAIKHGISKSMTAGHIEIRAKRRDNMLQMQIQNDGPAFIQNGNGLIKEGIGIANTRQRLRQLYNNDFCLDLMPLEEGASVMLEIPFNEITNGHNIED